ncbi:probable Putative mitochondrial carnitine O-acetyltransferase [Saccharomycodes ludwigii]|uniref:Probable Putative mitochondrial carnitine O-acetyltransferase n=1 Tax=Saccharomycodes ludwigii TaxID=36035 RepID=A0A376B5W4_9ASCO|nr:hypothetical protein SCDLUD_000847 [Saccharomycodes ludwigii]KAH3903228.1 hypothetical protein SCDLUD_000847 [Saccharomycodes ludwigii]SSD60063.1 probable Putative mitochondrial carnitine O-acetyltransferase [Saccharomycodes ludwigii]
MSNEHIATHPENNKKLARLPVPDLKDTLQRYLARLEPLQEAHQHEATVRAVLSNENIHKLKILQNKLLEYDHELDIETNGESSYIEQFWFDAYLEYDASVVFNVNPFFQLQDDPTLLSTDKDVQIKRSAKLVLSMLKFVREIRKSTLKQDTVRGKTPLSMDQYSKLFGSARLPPNNEQDKSDNNPSCHLQTDPTSHHIVVIHKSRFYWFDVLDTNNNPIFQSPEELECNLYSIIQDCLQNADENNSFPAGVFTTENRKVWSNVRSYMMSQEDDTNSHNLKIIDSALFILCLDDISIDDERRLVQNLLCGESKLINNYSTQTGTFLNRWFDKLQLIVTENGKAGINFEHTGVDGHTVLRMCSDIYTDSILSFASSITKNVPRVFHQDEIRDVAAVTPRTTAKSNNLITIPRRLEWVVDSFLLSSIHFAETRASDLMMQYEFDIVDFHEYGANHIKRQFHVSPDAFIQMIFQLAYYALYGKFETTYEPAMTKTFKHGRTEAIRSVSNDSKKFVHSIFDNVSTDRERVKLLQEACKEHSRITKEASCGLGQDRHLYALYCVWKEMGNNDDTLPPMFSDKGWKILNTNILSTSNCGNPCLKSFGFGPVTNNGFGLGYIIRPDSVTIVLSSKHRQTERFAKLIEKSLLEINHVFERKEGSTFKNTHTLTETKGSSTDMKFLMSGYDYFDVSVHG